MQQAVPARSFCNLRKLGGAMHAALIQCMLLSDFASPFACKESFERDFRFCREQAIVQDLAFERHARRKLIASATHQFARRRDGARR